MGALYGAPFLQYCEVNIMDRHVCKQCGKIFIYCRSCVFKPVFYKDKGYCSLKCYEQSKIKEVPSENSGVVLENDEGIETTLETE